MGPRQEHWFYNSLKESDERGAAWRVVGNQLIFSRLFENDEGEMSADNWNVSIPSYPVNFYTQRLRMYCGCRG